MPGGVGVGVVPAIEWDTINAAACLEASGRWTPAGEGGCVNGVPEAAALDCAGEEWVEPRWRRYRVPPATEYSAWERVDYGSCGEQVVPVLTAEDFRRLPLPVPAVHVQPDTGWVLVNKETIVYTDPTPATLTTQLLGRNVTVEATPARYTYEWGDGSRPLETTDPGSPYPDFDVFHVYEELGEVAITVTTEWSGRYQVEGDPQWREVAGTATTSATGPAFEVAGAPVPSGQRALHRRAGAGGLLRGEPPQSVRPLPRAASRRAKPQVTGRSRPRGVRYPTGAVA